jgi:hypothetical protein
VTVEPIPDAVHRDPIFRLAGVGVRRWIVIAVVAAATTCILATPDVRIAGQEPPTEFQMLGRLAWAVIGVPVGLYLYLWVPIAVSTLIRDLVANGALVDPEGEEGTVAASVAAIDRRMDSMFWPAAGSLAVAGCFAFELVKLAPAVSANDRIITTLAVAGTAVAIYAGTVLVLRLIVGMIDTSRAISQAESRVIPLHGDEAGGWGGFGRAFFVLARGGIAYGAVAILINAAAIAANLDPTRSATSMVTLASFAALPPLVVWGWFFAPHRAMLDARARALAPLSDAAGRASLAGLGAGDGDDPTTLPAGSERLDELIRRRDLIVATHPTWPLRLVEIRAVWATAFAPVIAAVVATVAGIVGDWLDGLV